MKKISHDTSRASRMVMCRANEALASVLRLVSVIGQAYRSASFGAPAPEGEAA